MRKSKILIILTLCLVLITSSVYAHVDEEKISGSDVLPSSEVILEYLLDAGYPIHIIESLDDDTKLEFYEGKYRYESSETTYGIFTEEHHISYTLDNGGQILIDDENLKELKQLLTNDLEIAQILHDKEQSASCLDNAVIGDKCLTMPVSMSITNDFSTVTESEYIQKREMESRQFMSENAQLIESIKAEPPTASLYSLTNWSASMLCSHISYSGGVAKKNLRYIWNWKYGAWYNFIDKAAMAWSGGFTAEPDTISWSYIAYGMALENNKYKYTRQEWSGKGYNDYDAGAGVGKDIDIVGNLYKDGINYVVYHHHGSLSTDLTKVTNTNSRESAVGRYFHKEVTASGLGVSFSASGPSISVSFGSNYDQSSDTAVAFWATTK